MNFLNARVWDDFVLFARAEKLSGDLNPTAIVLCRAYDASGIAKETAIWRSLLYLTWYHLGSAERVWTARPCPAELDHVAFASLPVGIERRSFKGVGGNVLARTFVRSVLRQTGGASLNAWVRSFGTGEVGWRSARRELGGVAGAGPWASWKFAELLRAVHKIPIWPADIDGAPTAVTAIAAIVGEKPGDVSATARDLFLELKRRGVELEALDELREILIRFAALLKGTYYVGHDIDLQMSQLDGASPGLWSARAGFPDAYRGERATTPWSGVRKELKKRYASHGELVNLWV